MNEQELLSFIDYYNQKLDQMNYDMYVESKQQDNDYLVCGLLPKLFLKNDPKLLALLRQPCNHDNLKELLQRYLDESSNTELSKLVPDFSSKKPEIIEPLAEWIYNYNYMLAYPLCGGYEKDNTLMISDPEMILSYVYIYLRINYSDRYFDYSFHQPLIDSLYKDSFDKSSTFKKWGLLPIDNNRILCALDEPVRIYDKTTNRTIFIMLSRSLALIFDELINDHFINSISFRGIDNRIYEGENHLSTICEAVEKGLIFSFDLEKLPNITKLYKECNFEDTLWVIKDNQNITFEELCSDFHTAEDTIVTQMIHLEYDNDCITHIDHEYIFYSIEEYDQRLRNPHTKGEARKRVKTFKVDKSSIPMNYPCKMFRNQNRDLIEVKVPFIYFVLNSYFEHKELLEEYFSDCLTNQLA